MPPPSPLRTTVGVGVFLVIAFVVLAWKFATSDPTELDRSVSLWVHGFDSDPLDRVMRFFSYVGAPKRLITVVTFAVVSLWRSGSRGLATLVLATYVAALGANSGLKLLFQRTRPDLFFEIALPESYSFPSGHALLSTAVLGSIALAVGQLRPGWRRMLYPATALVVFTIGLSRVYLGVHWVTDVAAGFTVGGILLVAFCVGAGRLLHGTSRGR